MANAMRVHSGNPMYVQIPVASATAVEVSDMLEISGNLGVVVTTATDNLGLYAMSTQAHEANAGAMTLNCVRLMPGVIFKYPLNESTSVAFGDNLQISGPQELTKSDTDPVANAVETNAAATSILCEFKVSQTMPAIGDPS